MIKISIIGTGYVGLVTGTCLSEFGFNVICMDVDEERIWKLKEGVVPIYEPGLEKLVEKNSKEGRLSFTTSIEAAVQNSTAIFIAVGTPPREDGSADLQYVLSAARSIARCMDGYKVIVDKSTVPVGTGRMVKEAVREVLDERGVNFDFDVVSNPEFLREGAALQDFMHPDRIVIGTENERAKEFMQGVYDVFCHKNYPFVFTNIETAELIKYASNAFLATKITFINEIANLCEAVGANVQQVAQAMGLDERIGKYFLHAGPGYGGSCLPKDTKALVHIGEELGVNMNVVDSVIQSNEKQKLRMAEKISSAMGEVEGKTIAVLGLAFKPETDDMRESPSITVVRELVHRGAFIRAFDPAAMYNGGRYAFNDIDIYYASDEYDAAANADALVMVTEWNRFRTIDINRIKDTMQGRFFFDLRNIFDRKTMEEAGFAYFAVGR